jgi:predicted nuclease with TOPRIM domain
MEMDTPEQQSKEPAKRRVRLASPRKQLERTIQKMTKLSETAETAMKPEKFVDLVTTLAGLQVKLLDIDRDAKDAEHEALIEENERLKSELAARPTDLDIQAKLMLAKIRGSDSGLLQQLEGKVETLKSRSAELQAENTELSTSNSVLKSTNSELTERVQSLLLENAKLQLTIKKLETRTPQELIDEAQSKLESLKW